MRTLQPVILFSFQSRAKLKKALAYDVLVKPENRFHYESRHEKQYFIQIIKKRITKKKKTGLNILRLI